MSTRYQDDARLNTFVGDELDAVVRQVSRVRPPSARLRPTHPHRFERVTVGAAARVLEARRTGLITAWEAEDYLHDLLAMDAFAGREAFLALVRAARERASTRRRTATGNGRTPEAPGKGLPAAVPSLDGTSGRRRRADSATPWSERSVRPLAAAR